MQTVDARFRAMVVEELGVSADQVVDGANFTADLGADSLDLEQLRLSSEDEFGISIPVDHAKKLLTVGEAVAYITARGVR